MVKQRLIQWIGAGATLAMLAGAARADMAHRYSFSGNGTDSIGSADGEAIGANAVITATHLDLTANDGQGSANPGIGGYFNLPNGIVSAAAATNMPGELVIELWTQASVNRNWAEVFTAGTSNDGEDTANAGDLTDYIAMIPQNGQTQLIRWTSHSTEGGGAEGQVNYTAPLSTTEEQHLVGVLANGTISLYVDGEFIGTADQAVDLDINTFNDNNNWLGRSQWNDPLFDGTVNEFRIYDAALNQRQIIESYLSGPDNPGSVTILPITNLEITGDQPNIFVDPIQLSVLLDSAAATDVELVSDPLLTWSSDDEGVLTVSQSGVVTPVGPGTATVTANFDGVTDTATITVDAATNVEITGDKPDLFVQEGVQLGVLLDSANVVDLALNANSRLIWSSSNEDTISVDQNGLAVGVRPGSATITAEIDGVSDSVTMTVGEVPDVLEIRHQYSFNSPASGELLPGTEQDLVGNADGTTWGAEYLGDGTMELNPSAVDPGFIENQGYVDLPNGIVSGLNNGTFEAWFTPTSGGGNWQRVWDFGITNEGEKNEDLLNDDINDYSGLDYIMLTRKVGADNIFQYEMNPPDGRPTMIIRSPVFQDDVPYHVVATYDSFGRSMALYVNGLRVGRLATDGTLLSQIDDVNNWLGRSNWGNDAFGFVNFDEMRLWEGVLPELRIAINAATGPDLQVSDPGALQSVNLTGPTDTLYWETPQTLQLEATANYANVAGVVVSTLSTTSFSSDDEEVVTVNTNGLVSIVGLGTATLTLDYEGMQDTFVVNVVEVNKPTTPLHRWSFNEAGGTTVSDSVGTANGTIIGVGGTFGEGQLTLAGGPNATNTPAGISAYVDLPNGMVSALPNAVSMELWTTWNDNGLGLWQRIFSMGTSAAGEDLANNGTSFVNLIARPGNNSNQLTSNFALTGQPNVTLTGPPVLVPGQENHIVLVWDFDLDFGRMYLNGDLVGMTLVNDDRTFADLAGLDVNVWFGRSQWSADGMYNGSFDEVRIHAGIMNQDDVTASMLLGPDMEGPTEVPLNVTLEGGNLSLSWPTAAGAAAESTTDLLGGTWSPVPGTPTDEGGTSTLIVAPTQDNEAFRLVNP